MMDFYPKKKKMVNAYHIVLILSFFYTSQIVKNTIFNKKIYPLYILLL